MTEPAPLNPSDALTRLDPDEKGVASTDTPGGPQQVNIINESGPDFTHLIPRRRVSRFFLR